MLSQTVVCQFGKELGRFTETEDALKFVKEHMEQEQYWPEIWWISDHGNVWQIDLEGNEIPVEEAEDSFENV